MIKALFNLPRPSAPIYVRSSRVAVVGVGSTSSSIESRNDALSSSALSEHDGASSWMKSDLEFPIRRVYCVGRNYREHAIEMGHDPDREPPFFFQKPSDAVFVCNSCSFESSSGDINTTAGITSSGGSIPYPPMTSSLHYEGEFIVAIGKNGLRIQVENAMDHVYGYSIGCDLTRRDLQSEAKKLGRPWDASKGFDFSCPMSPIVPKEDIKMDANTSIQLKVNGSIRQQSTIGSMIYSVPEIISNLSQLFRLQAGDIILTGTPAGVSHLNIGDEVSITCGDLIPCNFTVGEAE